MGITHTEFLNLAQQLAQENSEAALRSSVSRAYYAVYHHFKNWHDQLPCPGSSAGHPGGVHQELINRLRNPAPELKQEQKVESKTKAAQLEALRNQRHIADYKLSDTVEATLAKNACELAKKLLT
jgi:hypothetical protein